MLKKLKKTLTLSEIYNKKIDTSDIAKLELIKDEMIDEMKKPVGWHTMGVPLVASCFLALFSFIIPQVSFWKGIYALMGWPQYALMIGIMVSAFSYAFLIVLSLFFVAKGSYLFFKIPLSYSFDNNIIFFALHHLLFFFGISRLRRACITIWSFICGSFCCIPFL